MNTGVSARLTGPNSAGFAAHHPELLLESVLVRWRDLQSGPATFNATLLDPSIGDAHDLGYELIVRVTCGVDAPGWLEHATKPVKYVDTLSNDPNPAYAGRPIHWPVPWDPNLAWWHRQLLSRLADWADQPCPRDPSHTRAAHVHSWPLSRPTEDGTEMTLGYGKTEPNRTKNKQAWDHIGIETLRQRWLREAWWENIVDFLAVDLGWSCCLAGGALFEDAQKASNELLTRVASLPTDQRGRIIPMVTNLSRGDQWPTTQKALAEWLDRAKGYGLKIGLQFAGVAVLPDNDLSAIESAVGYAQGRYGDAITFFEAQPVRLDGAIYDYLLTVQAGMQPPRFQVSESGGVWYVIDADDADHFAHFHGFDAEARAVAHRDLLTSGG